MIDTGKLKLNKEEMLHFGYQVIDTVVHHFEHQNEKSPVSFASREEMDKTFDQNIPEEPSNYQEVLDFVVK